MSIEISMTTTILPGGKIELSSPEFVAGQQATVLVKIEDEQPHKYTVSQHLARANYHGGRLFTTADEVDAYIREQRDTWEG